jgi:hypothetical protein
MNTVQIAAIRQLNPKKLQRLPLQHGTVNHKSLLTMSGLKDDG